MNPLRGVAYKILAALVFTIMSAGIKRLGTEYPTGQIVFFRSAFALVPLLLWLSWNGRLRRELRTSNVSGHILRGLAGSCGMFANFVALAYLPLSDAVVIGYAGPLLTVILAAILLRETVRAYRWSAVGIGFAGVLVMLFPYLELGRTGAAGVYLTGAAFALGAAGCNALSMIQVRRMTSSETIGSIVFYFSIMTTVIGGATIVFGWTKPGLGELGLLVVIGVLGGIGQILQTLSCKHADASVVAAFDYTSMIWAFLLGWMFFGQLPGPSIVVGGAIIAAAGVFVIWRERQLGLAREKQIATVPQRQV